jgi:hypothetical protein
MDEDTGNRALARALRARGLDVLTAQEADRMGVADQEQLAFAALSGRVICTFNVRDFVALHSEYMLNTEGHCGVIVSDQADIGTLIRRILKLAATLSGDDMQNRLEYLSSWR